MRDRKGQLIVFTGRAAMVDADGTPVLITIVHSESADLFKEATLHDCVLTDPETGRIWTKRILEPIVGWPKRTWQVFE